MPTLLRQILEEALRTTADLEVVCLPASEMLESGVEHHHPDVLVTGYEQDEPNLYAGLLRSFPELRVLALVSQGKTLVAYQLRPTRVELGELSPIEIRDLIRQGEWEDLSWQP
jgi:hypothetical protein